MSKLRVMLRRRGRPSLRCEVHVPISPTPVFILRVRMLAASLRRFSDLDCRVIVTVGREVEPYDLYAAEPWSREAGIEWRWMSEEAFAAYGIYGTAMMRFTYDFEAPFVLMLDADVLCAGSLAELPALTGEGIGGVMAWVTPMHEPPRMRDGRERTAARFWHDLFASAGLPAPALDHEHPSWRMMDSPEDYRLAPAYFNLGMLAAKAETMRTVGRVVLDDLDVVDRFADTRFRCQLGLSISAARTGVALVPLPPRFNFPNSPFFWDAYPGEHEVRIVHYAITDEIDREKLVTLDDVEAVTTRMDLTAPNALLRDRLAALLGAMQPA